MYDHLRIHCDVRRATIDVGLDTPAEMEYVVGLDSASFKELSEPDLLSSVTLWLSGRTGGTAALWLWATSGR